MMKYGRRYWITGVIAAAWLVFAFPYWGKGLVPFPSTYLATFFAPWSATYGMPVKNNAMPDVITQIFPWKRVTIRTWRQGEIPLWNPYSFAGTMHAGNYQSAVFSPVNALFFLLPEVHAWSIMILLQPLLAGYFMYLFLRSLSLSRQGSAIGSLSFMFCGFLTVWMAYGTLGYAALMLPLILYAANRFMSGRRHLLPLLVLGLAWSFLSGHFQISMYTAVFTCAYVLFLIAGATKKRRAWWLFGAIAAGFVVASPQILPSLSAYAASVRSGLFLKGEIIPWSYLVTLFSPDFYGNPVTRNDWFGHYAEWASFVGVAPLMLAGIALWQRRNDRTVSFFGLAVLAGLLLALPTPINDWMYRLHIPVFSTSSASRIIVLVSFSLAALSAYGLDAVAELWKTRRKWRIVIPGIVFLAVYWTILKFAHPLPADKLVIAVRNSYLPSLLAVVTLGVIGIGFFLSKPLRRIGMVIIIGLVAFDMVRYASKWMPFDPQALVYPEEPVLTFVSRKVSETEGRVFGNLGGEVGAAFGLPLIEGYDAVYQGRYGEFIQAAADGTIRSPERSVVKIDKHGRYTELVLELMGVRYLAHRVSDGRFGWAYPFWKYSQYRQIWHDPTYEVFENTDAYPRAFLASGYRVERDDAHIISAMFSDGTNLRDELILETAPSLRPSSGSGTVRIIAYQPTRVSFAVSADVPKLLFLSDVYDPGWHAAIDGAEVKVYRADYAFRAVAVPAGEHSVVMWYWPGYMTYALLASGFVTLWCIVWMKKTRTHI